VVDVLDASCPENLEMDRLDGGSSKPAHSLNLQLVGSQALLSVSIVHDEFQNIFLPHPGVLESLVALRRPKIHLLGVGHILRVALHLSRLLDVASVVGVGMLGTNLASRPIEVGLGNGRVKS
jgi:hypothetical protein